MEFFYTFLGGLLCKIYDDLTDNSILKDGIFKEVLKGSQYILLTLISYNDFNFALLNYIINVGNAINNWTEWHFPYETSMLILAPFFVLISFSTRFIPQIIDYIFIFFSITTLALEPLIIKEEYSYRKFVVRLGTFLLVILSIFGGTYFGISPSFLKVSYYALGYFLFSSIFQGYLLYKSTTVKFPTSFSNFLKNEETTVHI